jgi:predicted Zn-dependent peptidase
MNRLARQELRFGTFHSVDEMLGQISGVRPEEVEALIQRLLDVEQACLVTLGPVDKRHLPRELGV